MGLPRTAALSQTRPFAAFVRRFGARFERFAHRVTRPAGWPLNLDADPRAKVQVGAEVFDCRARRLAEVEADRYWPAFVESFPGHASYRERSGARHTFILEPERPE